MTNNKLIEKPDWEMLGKFLSHETTKAETELVEKWINQSGKNRKELDKIKLLLEQSDSVYKLKQYNTEAAWQKVTANLEDSNSGKVRRMIFRKKGISSFYKYAAVLIVAILLGAGGYYFGFQNQLQNIYTTEATLDAQNTNEYVLPDGSVVTLNSESKISYPKRFKGKIREVTISGEAFFDVQPNPEKPFIINAGETQIKVLGTSFNVSAYPEDEKVEVVVESGKVEVSHKNDLVEKDEKILLTRGEKGTLLKKDNLLEKSINNDTNYLAWKTHNLVFEKTPMKQVISYLKKVYHINIQVKDEEINEMLLSAEFDKKPVDFVLNVVQLTFNLNLSHENDQYILAKQINNNN